MMSEDKAPREALGRRLRIEGIAGDAAREGDFHTAVLKHFPKAQYVRDDVIEYLTEDGSVALRVVHGRNGIKRVDPGPALTEDDVIELKRGVETVIFADGREAVRREILLSRRPVQG